MGRPSAGELTAGEREHDVSDDGTSDDGGYSPLRGGSGGSSDLNVLRRAMRWETFALVAFLVILAIVAS
ncbi:hypothetical protein [Streptomyces sp. NEAU-S7GS2]|uniref:hypothetical protein n=1 Tax=Streptomyces sp. NEAU-S7GS2 TaxID=2202000 RepID=UPI000D704EC9|nr:hypothetical protein [Streptomyces sp. NEAU-S7GS2]AWN31410.1 hypothetical protein DKG71_39790 [Streptomyces sp. NEAU-S7GS2]